MAEVTQAATQKTLLRGIVYFDQNPCAIECTVRELSDSVGRVQFASVPNSGSNTLELQIPIKGIRRQCRVTARHETEYNIVFIDAHGLQNRSSLIDRVERLEVELAQLKQFIRRLRISDHVADVA
jgi:hypothetical protein